MYNNIVRFEWDENKRQINIKKHGLDFILAEYIFADPNAITSIDDRKEYGEQRFKTIGQIANELVAVIIHTQRANKTRIISLRPAKQKERKIYYGHY